MVDMRCECGFALFIPIGKVKFERGPVLVQEFTPMCFKCAACGKILQFDQGKIIKQMEEEN
jgi:hypothetical protein